MKLLMRAFQSLVTLGEPMTVLTLRPQARNLDSYVFIYLGRVSFWKNTSSEDLLIKESMQNPDQINTPGCL
jgi:hypothetical protein